MKKQFKELSERTTEEFRQVCKEAGVTTDELIKYLRRKIPNKCRLTYSTDQEHDGDRQDQLRNSTNEGSAVREGKPVHIYIPSRRIRDLLKKWLNNELPCRNEGNTCDVLSLVI